MKYKRYIFMNKIHDESINFYLGVLKQIFCHIYIKGLYFRDFCGIY